MNSNTHIENKYTHTHTLFRFKVGFSHSVIWSLRKLKVQYENSTLDPSLLTP